MRSSRRTAPARVAVVSHFASPTASSSATPLKRSGIQIGAPASYGCVRMKSSDVIELFDTVGVGSQVVIANKSLIALGLVLFVITFAVLGLAKWLLIRTNVKA